MLAPPDPSPSRPRPRPQNTASPARTGTRHSNLRSVLWLVARGTHYWPLV